MNAIPSLFVTGTDTGVGKTVVAAGVAAAFRRRGIDVGVMKPFATGARRRGGRLVSEDAEFLRRAAEATDPLETINPVCLEPPLAPSVAAKVSRRPVDLREVLRAYRTLRRSHEAVIVEGVGGLLVPILEGVPVARLVRRMLLPLLIVTRPALGTINHTALTVLAARSYGLKILGLVVNHHAKSRNDLAERTNAAVLESETGVAILGEVPYLGRDPSSALRHRMFDEIADRLEAGARRAQPGTARRQP